MKTEENSMARVIGKIIREARERLGLSQQDLADRMNEHHTRISAIERGKSLPSVRTIGAICGQLGIDPGEVVNISIQSLKRSDFKLSSKKVEDVKKLSDLRDESVLKAEKILQTIDDSFNIENKDNDGNIEKLSHRKSKAGKLESEVATLNTSSLLISKSIQKNLS